MSKKRVSSPNADSDSVSALTMNTSPGYRGASRGSSRGGSRGGRVDAGSRLSSPSRTSRQSSPGRGKLMNKSMTSFGDFESLGTLGSRKIYSREKAVPVKVSRSASSTFVNMNKDPTCLDLRKRVIYGDFMNGSFDSKGAYRTTNSIWKFKQWQMLVFISSTFTDTRLERNILLDDILPELRRHGIPHGVEVTFVDMRWGIRDEHTLKHRTWLECQRELQRCRDESCGLFFLSLQSHKYGYRPLPRTIDHAAFERVINSSNEDIKNLAKVWFQYDRNSISPQYVLRDLESLDDSAFWDNALPKLREAFIGVRFDKSMTTNVILGRSISEWEAKFSLITNEDCSRAMWAHRTFSDKVTDEKFTDAEEGANVGSKLKDLKQWINHKIKKVTPQRIHDYSNISLESYLTEQNCDFDFYTQSFKENTLNSLQGELHNIVVVKEEFDENGCGMNLPGKWLEEFLHHANWAHNLCLNFVSREKLVAKGVEMALKSNLKFEDSRAVAARVLLNGGSAPKYKSISFVIIGEPGVGKSAFMAKLANELYKLNDVNPETSTSETNNDTKGSALCTPPLPQRLVLVRFCGTGDGTTSMFSLISSLVAQIEYSLDSSQPPKNRSNKSAVRMFRELVLRVPMVIMIDSIDKITDGVDIFEDLSIHSSSRIIISISKFQDGSRMTNFAEDNDISCLEIPKYTTMSNRPSGEDAEVAVIVDDMLKKKSRKLSRNQRQYVLDKLETDPRAIYISLVLREVVNWHSFDNDVGLESLTAGIMSQILDKVEKDCGALMSRLAIGCLTLSVNGINDIEMEDVISLKDEVLYNVFQYDYPKVWRLPSHVWLRLRNSLIGLIVERQRGCLHWHHDELQVIASTRFNSKEEKDEIHRALGTYFCNRVDSDVVATRRITSQSLCLNDMSPFLPGAIINKRRCNEGAFHLIEGGLFVEAVEEMCNLDHVCACILCGEGHGLVKRLGELVALFDKEKEEGRGLDLAVTKRLHDYNHWLSDKFEKINIASPVLLLTVTASMEPVDSFVRTDLLHLLKTTRSDRETQKFSDKSWIRGLSLHDSGDGFAVPTFKTHCSATSWSCDGNKIATFISCDTVCIWDTHDMSIQGEMRCPNKNSILQVSWACDNVHVAISTRTEVFVWNCDFPNNKTAVLVVKLGDKLNPVKIGKFSPAAIELACASPNRTVTLWGGDGFSLQNTYTISKMANRYSKVSSKKVIAEITDVHWSKDGLKLSAMTVGNLRIWDRSDPLPKSTFTPPQGSRIASCDFSPDGKRLITSSEDSKVTVWNAETAAQHSVFDKHRDSVRRVSWNKDGVHVASGSKDGIVLIWNVLTGEVIQYLFGHYSDIQELSWSPDGLRLVSSSINDHYIMWDSTKTGRIPAK